MRRIQPILKWMTAFALMICAVLLAWQCANIYLDGQNAAVHPANQMYSWDDVARRLQSLAAPFAITAVITIASAVASRADNAPAKQSGGAGLYQRPQSKPVDLPLRGILLTLAVVFILLGVMNGGLRDVLVKAINICTECIGLG